MHNCIFLVWLTLRLNILGDPKNSISLLGVWEGIGVFAKQVNRHTFGFPMKNLIISDQYFRRFHCQKKNICNSAEFTNRINLSPKKWCWKNLRPHPDFFKITSKNLPYTFQTTNRHLLNLFKTPYKYLLNTFQTNSWPLQRVSRHTKQLSNDRNPILT